MKLELENIDDEDPAQMITLKMETRLFRSKDSAALPFKWTNDPDAPTVHLREEDILKNYPWSYKELTRRLSQRYCDFKSNADYHTRRKQFEQNGKYCKVRYLNPKNLDGGNKKLYNPNILKEFDKHYTKKTVELPGEPANAS